MTVSEILLLRSFWKHGEIVSKECHAVKEWNVHVENYYSKADIQDVFPKSISKVDTEEGRLWDYY